MTEINTTEDFLEHFGVKGMKWGQRRAAKKVVRADKKFERKAQSTSVTFKVFNGAADKFNSDVATLNSQPKYRDADFTRESPARRAYYAKVQKLYIDRLDESAAALGTNKSGTKRYGILEKPDGSWDVITKDVKHANDSVISLTLTFDDKGFITKIVPVDPMTHGEEDLDDFLEHFGVKGMKWGVRRGGSDSGPVSSDAAKAATFKQVAKKSGTKALSNEELQALVTRMNLEKQFNQLKPATPSKKATKFVGDFLLSVGKQQAAKFANDQIGVMITRAIKKA